MVVALFTPLLALLLAAPLIWDAPFPTADRAFFVAQLAKLGHQIHASEANGNRPISIVFVGTSRMRNVASNADLVARSATHAGVQRQVVSTSIGLNWGGFERLLPLIDLLADSRPDVVVIMPAFFYEDFSYRARLRLFRHYVASKLRGREYTFDKDEYYSHICDGFDSPVQSRVGEDRKWMAMDGRLPGPRSARTSVRKLANRGVLVVIADVPTSRKMMAARSERISSGGIADYRNETAPNVRIVEIGSLPDADYCDWAHVDPSHANSWQEALFRKLSYDLNRLN